MASDADLADRSADVSARVEAVCVVHAVAAGRWGPTAIDKRPTSGPRSVTKAGLVDDQQCSRGHGGPDRAVYVYAREDATAWEQRLARDLQAGIFGENVRTLGLAVSEAVIGERWQVGTTVLEIRMPRTPWANLSQRLEIEDFHREFAADGRVGAMCRVVEIGEVAAGDPITVVTRPRHGVTVRQVSQGLTSRQADLLLDGDLPLARAVAAAARRARAA